jgi:hypothetical protein
MPSWNWGVPGGPYQPETPETPSGGGKSPRS